VVLLLFLTQSSLRSSELSERIGIIYISGVGGFSLVSHTIDVSCGIWWQNNLKIDERLNPKQGENIYIHTINGSPVIGYICNP
jgi:hypothetical protein